MTKPPVLFLVFNRPDVTAEVMRAIATAQPSRLYVAADGPRPGREGEAAICEEVRRIATTVKWPCRVETLFREQNMGCRDAVSSAISWFFDRESEGVILEDDCLPSPDFFRYSAELLERYRENERVMAICGSGYMDDEEGSASYFFSYYADMWGWASWRRAWRHYDSRLGAWPAFKDKGGLQTISGDRRWHAEYWKQRFDATRDGRIDTWDYGWIFTLIERNGLAICPTRNMISNIGFGPQATHTVGLPQGVESPANRPHSPMGFPLMHPKSIARDLQLEQRVEEVRLNLQPPNARGAGEVVLERVRTGLRRCLRPARRLRRPPPETFLSACRYVVHVGANVGQEREIYNNYDLDVTWIEAIPEIFDELVANVSEYPNQRALQALTLDRWGVATTINEANDVGFSSSIFPISDLLGSRCRKTEYVRSCAMVSETIDNLVGSGRIRPLVDALIIAVPGAELLTLRGAENFLDKIRYVKVSAPLQRSYVGCATAGEIEKYMKGRSFRLELKTETPRPPASMKFCDLLFKRVSK